MIPAGSKVVGGVTDQISAQFDSLSNGNAQQKIRSDENVQKLLQTIQNFSMDFMMLPDPSRGCTGGPIQEHELESIFGEVLRILWRLRRLRMGWSIHFWPAVCTSRNEFGSAFLYVGFRARFSSSLVHPRYRVLQQCARTIWQLGSEVLGSVCLSLGADRGTLNSTPSECASRNPTPCLDVSAETLHSRCARDTAACQLRPAGELHRPLDKSFDCFWIP